MRLDRGEAQGTGLALLLHVGLVVALTTSLAHVPPKPEPPPMEVEMVDSDELALTAAAAQPAVASPAQAPEPAPPQPVPPLPPQPAPSPPPPEPLARPAPSPIVRPAPVREAPAQSRPRPRPSQARPAPAPSRPVPPRRSRLGDDFLKGLPDAPASASRQPAQEGAATFSAAAKASIDQAIKRQIQPCADRQASLGPGAERIRVVLNLRLDRSGRLSRPPTVVRTSGIDADNGRFEELAVDQAIAVYRACSPLRLPAELYSTPQGGWGNINMTYRAK